MVKNPLPSHWLVCNNPAEWRSWLDEHHMQADEVWLQISKAGSADPAINLADAVNEALCYGWIDGKIRSLDDHSYILRFTPRHSGSLWSLSNRQRAEALIASNRMTPAGLSAIREAQANGRWQDAYSSLKKPDIAPDLQTALLADPVAYEQFNQWSNSEQLQATYWIEQSKKPQTRQKRIAAVIARAHKQRR